MPETRAIPGTPSWLRIRNDRAALELLLEHGPLTRHRLCELTGLSKPTATQIMQRLESVGLVSVVGSSSRGRGPSANVYGVRTDQALGVAIDIDAHGLRAVVVDVSAHELAVAELPHPSGTRTAVEDVRAGIAAACAASGIAPERVDAVCVGVQCSVDQRADRLRFADTLPHWPADGAHALLERELGTAVTIENDVNLAAVAERAHGAGADSDGFVMLWLGEGLGLAVDVGGTLQRGASGGVGEIGYLPAPVDPSLPTPAARDLQDLFGGLRVAALTREAGGAAGDYAQAIAVMTTDAAVAARVVAALAPRVAAGLAPVLALLDPERIVLGGPTGTAGGAALADAVAAEVRRTTAWNPDIAAGRGPRHPVLAGAAEHLRADLRAALRERAAG